VRAWLSRPGLWLLVLMIGNTLYLERLGKLRLVEYPDASTYRAAAAGSWVELLSNKVTFFYPLLLKLTAVVDPSLGALPYLHFSLHLAGIGLFFFALVRFGFSPWLAFGAASALLFGPLPHYWMSSLGTDSVGGSLALISVACLLLTVGSPRRIWPWVAVATALFLTYQCRPAYLFLLPLLPPLGLALRGLLPRPAVRGEIRHLALGLIAAAALPYLAFCTLRLVTVGHFGLVSFGGYNLVGIAGQFVDGELVLDLPGDEREIATRYLARRSDRHGVWAGGRSIRGSFPRLDAEYVETVILYEEIAREVCRGNDVPRINRTLSSLAFHVLRQRPLAYGYWLLQAFQAGIASLAGTAVAGTRALLGLSLLLALAQAGVVMRIERRALPGPGEDPLAPRTFFALHTLLLLALSFALAKVLLVVLVEQPHPRYIHAAALLLPPVLGTALADRLLRLFGPGGVTP